MSIQSIQTRSEAEIVQDLLAERAALRPRLHRAARDGDTSAIMDLQARATAVDTQLPYAELAALRNQIASLEEAARTANAEVDDAAAHAAAARVAQREALDAAQDARLAVGTADGAYHAAEARRRAVTMQAQALAAREADLAATLEAKG